MTKEADPGTAYHEAGHAVIGVALGLRVKSATVCPTDEYEGCVEFEDWGEAVRHTAEYRATVKRIERWRRKLEEAEAVGDQREAAEAEFSLRGVGESLDALAIEPDDWWLEAHAVASLAGWWAEKIATGIDDDDGAAEDRYSIAQWSLPWSYLRDGTWDWPALDRRTETLVREHWRGIERVARLLLGAGTLAGEELADALREGPVA